MCFAQYDIGEIC